MKKLVIYTISLYQLAINSLLKNILGTNKFCRFSPTCSEYAKSKIREEGILRGATLASARIAKCHPFSKSI